MATPSTRQLFLKSEKATLLRVELVAMVESVRYNTKPIYSNIESDEYQFVERRMEYMSKYPNMDHWQYLRNLKLMTEIK